MKPDYYLSHNTIERFATQNAVSDFEMDVKVLAQEFLVNEKRLLRALKKLAKRSKEAA